MKLELHYRGVAVESGRMSARDLGPAIYSMGTAMETASRILYGDSKRLKIEVDADFQQASFGVEFYAVASHGADLVAGLTLADLANLAQILGFIGGPTSWSVIKLLRWQRKRAIEKVEKTKAGDVALTIHNETITVNQHTYNVFADADVRKSVGEIVEPLLRPGIDSLEFRSPRQESEYISKDEAEVIRGAPGPEEAVGNDESMPILEVVSPTFRAGNKWKFGQGEVSFFAPVLDESFLDRVERHDITFGKGDALRVRMETTTSRIAGELHYERQILEVLEYMPAAQTVQTRLDLSTPMRGELPDKD